MNIYAATLATAAALSACGSPSTPSASALKVTNGKVIAESDQPAVVNLYRPNFENGKRKGAATCTGTWIGPNTILTAAHCVGPNPTAADGTVLDTKIVVFAVTDHTTMPKKTKRITTVTKVARNPLWERQKGTNRYDLAVLETAPLAVGERERVVIALSSAPAHQGESIAIVGYGFNNMSPFRKGGDDHKRIGTNTIASVRDGMINITGEAQDVGPQPTGERASAGDGDSGGPMLRDGQLIGVASAGGTSGIFGQGEASYIDLNSPESRAFLAPLGY